MVAARTKSAVLWGVVGALAFLVLAQGYLLVSGERVAYTGLFGVAAVVFVAAAGASHVAVGRLDG